MMMPATKCPAAVRSEKQEQAAIKKLLAMVGVAVYDTSQPFRAAITPGVPDLIAFSATRGLFFVEVKRAGGKQSPAQREFESRCLLAGVPYVVGGVEAVAAFLKDRSATRRPESFPQLP